MIRQRNIFFNIDWISVSIYLALVFIGWFNIHAAVYDVTNSSIFDLDRNYGKQLIWILTSFVLISIILLLDSKFFATLSYPTYIITVALLILVLIVGRVISGNQGWIDIGSFKLQPAEFAKFATAMALARFLSGPTVKFQQLGTKLLAFGIVLTPILLILLQGDVGSAITFSAFVLVLYREGLSPYVLIFGFVGVALFLLSLLFNEYHLLIALIGTTAICIYYFRKSRKIIVKLVVGFMLSVLVIFGVNYVFDSVLKPHHQARINVLIGKEIDLKGAGYNVNQSKIAIGSGGVFGKGYLQGTQTKYDFVPEQSTDFIFCTIGEEWGFVGSFIVLALFTGLLMRIIFLAERQRSAYSRIYGYCVASILFFHLMINIGMTIGLMPVIGIPLPFISYGGSSLWSFTILLFILIKLDSNRMGVIR